MNMTISAIYENGMLRPRQPLELAEGALVQLTICSGAPATSWTDEGEVRRRELIELEVLDRLANEHFDRVATPPIDGARRLHERLLNS